jgi:acyl carrier protein
VKDKIAILKEYLRVEIGCDEEIDPDIDLLESRILDSYSIVQMAVFIQERFEVELDADDLVRANLSRLSAMAALIEKKLAA